MKTRRGWSWLQFLEVRLTRLREGDGAECAARRISPEDMLIARLLVAPPAPARRAGRRPLHVALR